MENCSAKEWHSRRGMEKIPNSQALGIYSGFLSRRSGIGMTSKCIFPQLRRAGGVAQDLTAAWVVVYSGSLTAFGMTAITAAGAERHRKLQTVPGLGVG